MTTATQSEFAALLGKDKSYVTRLKQAGRLVLAADGLVDVEKSQALIAATADPSRNAAVEARTDAQLNQARAPHSTGSGQAQSQQDAIGNSFQTAKAVNEKYKALTAKLEYEQDSGKLVDAGEARLFAADLAATFRGALEVLPDRLAPELVPLNETETIRAAGGIVRAGVDGSGGQDCEMGEGMNLSPWFKSSEPPEREGLYQVKNWIGHINYMEWRKGAWRDPKTYDHIHKHWIRGWRGVTKP